MKIESIIVSLSLAAFLGGCGASLPGFTTGSLFGGNKPAPVAQNDAVSRAMDVGATSARAIKCGYNFDAAKLRGQYLAAETVNNPADADKLGKVYDASFNGVSKALAEKGDEYCSGDKTARIKAALTRHLAGDYTPSPPEVAQDESLFSDWGSSSPDGKGANMTGMLEH